MGAGPASRTRQSSLWLEGCPWHSSTTLTRDHYWLSQPLRGVGKAGLQEPHLLMRKFRTALLESVILLLHLADWRQPFFLALTSPRLADIECRRGSRLAQTAGGHNFSAMCSRGKKSSAWSRKKIGHDDRYWNGWGRLENFIHCAALR